MHVVKWKDSIWKATYCMLPALWHSGKGKLQKQRKDRWLPRFGRREGEELSQRVCRIFVDISFQFICVKAKDHDCWIIVRVCLVSQENDQTVFQCSQTTLLSHQRWIRIPAAPSICSPASDGASVFDFGHSNRCVVVSHGYFKLQFASEIRSWASWHTTIVICASCLLRCLFGTFAHFLTEILVKSLCPDSFCFLLISWPFVIFSIVLPWFLC